MNDDSTIHHYIGHWFHNNRLHYHYKHSRSHYRLVATGTGLAVATEAVAIVAIGAVAIAGFVGTTVAVVEPIVGSVG